MRDINVPITETYSVTVDPKSLKSAPVVDLGDGQYALELPNIVDSAKQEITAIARQNGGKVLYAATSVERKVDQLLLHYFMGTFTGPSDRRVMFEAAFLQSSALQYRTKKELVAKILNSEKLLPGKKINVLQGHLKKIMLWRNAFAHGQIQYDSRDKCFVRHYSGSQKKLRLDDDYWDTVEQTFQETDAMLTESMKALQRKFAAA